MSVQKTAGFPISAVRIDSLTRPKIAPNSSVQTPAAAEQGRSSDANADTSAVVLANAAEADWEPNAARFGTGRSDAPSRATSQAAPATSEVAVLPRQIGLSQLQKLFQAAGLSLDPRQQERFLSVFDDLTPQAKKGLTACAERPESFRELVQQLQQQLQKENYSISQTRVGSQPGQPSATQTRSVGKESEKQSLLRGYLDALLAPRGIDQTASPGAPGVVNDLLNFEHNGRIKFEANDPEKPSQLQGTTRLFSSSMLQQPAVLDANTPGEVYAYCDTSKLGNSRRPIYHAEVYTNTSNVAGEIHVKGSAFTANPKDLPRGAVAAMEGSTTGEKEVRAADDTLQTSMLTGNYQTDLTRVLQPGESLVVWTALREDDVNGKVSQKGNNVRSQYLVDVKVPGSDQPPPPGTGPQIQVDVMLSDRPEDLGINPNDPGFHGDATLSARTHPDAFQHLTAAPLISAREIETNEQTGQSFPYLKRGTDFDQLRSAYSEVYQAWQSRPPADRATYLATELSRTNQALAVAEAELKQAATPAEVAEKGQKVTRLEHLSFVFKNFEGLRLRDVSTPGQLSSTEIDDYQDKINRFRRGERGSGLSDGDLLPLRRMAASIRGNQASGVVPQLSAASPGEYMYAVNTKYLSRAGSLQDQSAEVISPLMIENRPANVTPKAHGNYGTEYSTIISVANPTSGPKRIELSFSKSNERRTNDQGGSSPNYTDDRTGPEKNARAFTGTVRILIPGQEPKEVKVVQGHIQDRQLLASLSVEAGKTLNINIQFVVPNNSTGPELVHVKLL